MATASEKLQIILELVTGQYRREATSAAQATSQIARAAEKAGLSTAQLDRAMTTTGRALAGFGAVAVGSLGLAAKAAIDWESAFAGVRKTVEASEPEFAALEKGLLDLSLVAPVAAEELAGIAEAAGQLGIKNEAILDFTKTMAALGVTTNLTADEAATAFARLANIMQIPQDQFDEMGSTVVELGNKLASTESEIVDFATRIAGAGRIAGLSAAEVFSIAGAFSSVGVEAEAGGTAVQKVLLNMTEAVATGGENLATFARVSGVTAQEFITLWREDAAGAFTLFVEGLGRAGNDAFGILQQLGLEDQRLIRSFLSLAGAGDLLRESVELGNDAWRDNTALSKEAEERYATVASELQILVNSIKVLAIEIGNTLLPAIRVGADAAQALVKWFTDMPEPLRIAVVALTGLVGTVTLFAGAALILIPRIAMTITAIRDLRAAIVALRAANLAGALGGSGAAAATSGGVAGLATAVGLVGAAVLALEVGIRAAKGATDDWTSSSNDWQQSAGGFIQGLDVMGVLTGNFSKSIEGAATALVSTKNVAKETTPAIVEIHDSWTNAGRAAGETVGPTDNATAAIQGYGTAASRAAGHALAVASAQRAITQALLEAANPAVAAASALDRVRDAQQTLADVQEDAKSSAEDIAQAFLDLAIAKLEAQGALDAFDAGGISGSATAIARALEIPYEQALLLLETLGLIDGMTVTATVVTSFVDRGSAASGDGSGRTYIGGKQHGGPVWSGQPYIVGEAGPELFIPQRSGTIVPNHQLGGVVGGLSWSSQMMLNNNQMLMPVMSVMSMGGSNSVTINVESPMKDFRTDLQYATILASVTNLVETHS